MNNKTFLQVEGTGLGCIFRLVEFQTGGFDQRQKWSVAVTIPDMFLDGEHISVEMCRAFIVGLVDDLQRELDATKTRAHARVTIHIPPHRLRSSGWQNNGYYIAYLVRGGQSSVYLPGSVITNLSKADDGLTFSTQRRYVNDDLAAYIVT